MGRFQAGLCVALLLISSSGCGSAEREATPALREARAARPPVAVPSKSEPRLVVEAAGNRVRLVAREIARRELLEELAFEARFVLEFGDFEPRSVTLRLEDASLNEVLGAVLAGTPYGIDYDFDHRIQTLRVGSFEEPPVARVPAARDESASGVRGGESTPNAASWDRLANLREHQTKEEAESEPLLADPRPEVRVEAAYDYDPEGPLGLDPLIGLALSDPDPGVRAAAAETLGHEGSPPALLALVKTLQDPSPEVVRTSIETLALVGDRHHAESIRPFLRHPDAEVREAAELAVEVLE